MIVDDDDDDDVDKNNDDDDYHPAIRSLFCFISFSCINIT